MRIEINCHLIHIQILCADDFCERDFLNMCVIHLCINVPVSEDKNNLKKYGRFHLFGRVLIMSCTTN